MKVLIEHEPSGCSVPTAYDLTRKVDSQRCEASTKLNFRPFPRRQSSLRSLRSSDVVRRRVWMTDERVLCDTQEGLVLCFVVFFQAGNMVQEITLKRLVSVLLLAAAQTGIFTSTSWIGCHFGRNLSSGTEQSRTSAERRAFPFTMGLRVGRRRPLPYASATSS